VGPCLRSRSVTSRCGRHQWPGWGAVPLALSNSGKLGRVCRLQAAGEYSGTAFDPRLPSRPARVVQRQKVCYAHRVLSVALTAAVRNGRLVRNVAEGVPLPRVVGKPKRFLTHDQVQALAEVCAPYGTLIKVLASARRSPRWAKVRVCSSKTAAGMRCARSSDLVRSSSVSARPAPGTAERPCRARQRTQTSLWIA
jgi:hypothetical protein